MPTGDGGAGNSTGEFLTSSFHFSILYPYISPVEALMSTPQGSIRDPGLGLRVYHGTTGAVIRLFVWCWVLEPRSRSHVSLFGPRCETEELVVWT